MDPAGGQGLQTRADITSGSEVAPLSFTNKQGKSCGRGDPETVREGGDKDGSQLPEPVSQPYIPGAQERWIIQTGSQLETPKSVHGEDTLQDGKLEYDQRPTEGRRLDGLHRPEGCVSLSSDLGGSPEIPSLPMAGQGVRVSVPSLRAVQRSTGLHQAAETGIDAYTTSRNTAYNVPGRYASDDTVQDGAGATTRSDHFPPGDVRVCSQQGEVTVTASSENPVLRLPNRLAGQKDSLVRGEDITDCRSMSKSMPGRNPLNTGIGTTNWEANYQPYFLPQCGTESSSASRTKHYSNHTPSRH